MSQVKVSILKRKNRTSYYMQYRDPVTENKITQSAKTTVRRDAERAAAKWEAEILQGLDKRQGRMSWEEFRERYTDEVLESLADRTLEKVDSVFNVFETLAKPRNLAAITPDVLSRYQQRLREEGRAETTIKGHLAHLLAALSWAVDQGLLREVPKVKKPKRAKKPKVMKGRPIATEEFERMLANVEKIVTTDHMKEERNPPIVASWNFYLRGLWLSGLRLDESMRLHWTDRNELCVMDLDKQHPMLYVKAEAEKGHEDRILPMSPEFAEFLRAVPRGERCGYVFNPQPRRARYGERLTSHRVGIVVSDIGEAAGVKVDETDGKVKFASAHDLRRSFGERWARKIMPAVLQELMRHESIHTTMRYYVGRNAKATAAILWELAAAQVVGDQMGDQTKKEAREVSQTP